MKLVLPPARFIAALFAVHFAFTLNSAGETLVVPGDHDTIQQAIDAADPGDTVLVGPGTWNENLELGGKDVRVESQAGPTDTIVDGNGGTVVDIGPDGALVGFTVTGGIASFGAGMDVHGTGTLVEGNVFEGNMQTGGGFGAAIGGNSASPLIVGNLFRDNSCDTQFLSGVVAFVNSSRPRIINNVFEDNPCRAINMTLPSSGLPEVLNNTMVRNFVGIRVDARISTAQQIYRNNIVVDNDTGIVIEFGGETNMPTFEHNLVFGNGVDYDGIGDRTGIDGNISEDPRFRSAQSGGYRLRPDSPAIDTGTASLAPDTDFDGLPRPIDGDRQGAAHDIGAFEFMSLFLEVEADGRFYTKGDEVRVSIGADNPGIPTALDFHLALLYPDGDMIVYFTDRSGSRATGSLGDLQAVVPMAPSFDLTTPFDVFRNDFVSVPVTDAEPIGSYKVFWQAIRPGTLADNAIDPGDVVAEGVASFRVE